MGIVNKDEYKNRIIDAQVQHYLDTFGAVCIEGPKWCGKTWTSSYHSKSEFLTGDPENNFQNRNIARMSPSIVLEGETPRMIDEWQEVPALWDAVRFMVDKRGKKAQFIMTGSSTPNTKGVLHSGAGRIGRLRMHTMSLFESGDSSGVISLEQLCSGELTAQMTGEVDLKRLIYYVVRGGWPGNIGVGEEEAGIIPKSYIDAILEDDTQRVDGIKYNRKKVELLMRSLARNESTTATNSKLINDLSADGDARMDRDTVADYLSMFERLFLRDDQEAFSNNIRSATRLKKAPKRHFCDPAISCALLQIGTDRLLNDLNTFGFMFEALCERDLKIYAESFGAKLYHYQDYKNREIDAVVQSEDGTWCAFEIKLGAHQIDEAAGNLLNLSNSIKQEGGQPPAVLCVICGLSNAAYVREDGVFVVPITALRN